MTLFVLAAQAQAAGPALRIDALSNTTAPPGGQFDYFVQLTNVGDADTSGDINVTATLPPGLTAVSAANNGPGDLTCTGPGGSDLAGATLVTCTTTNVVTTPGPSSNVFLFVLTVAADPAASGPATASFEVSGGGAPSRSTVAPITLAPAPPGFGPSAFDGQVIADPAGDPYTQAAGHPYAASTSFDFNTATNPSPLIGPLWPVEPAKDILVDLPPGLVGNPGSAAQCDSADLANSVGLNPRPLCPPSSQLGTVMIRLNGLGSGLVAMGPLPVFNLAPPPGVPAEFGFNVVGSVVTLQGRLRSGSDFGLSVDVHDIPEGLDVAGTTFTFWGVPADPSHDAERACPGQDAPWVGGPSCPSGASLVPFLRNPTSCTPAGVGLPTTMHMDSWDHPAAVNSDGTPDLSDPHWQSKAFLSHDPPGYPANPADPATPWGPPQGPTGCDSVPFTPSIDIQPTSSAADSPSGLQVDLNIPQDALSQPNAVAQSDLRKAVVTLPAGMAVNPSSADGLAACTSAQIDLHGQNTEPTCPDGSKLGTVTIDTPLLPDSLQGSVYLAKQSDNPFGSLLALYIVASGDGVVVKLPGRVEADPASGRLTTTFDNQPQLPFSHLSLRLDGGPRAPLTTSPTCGGFEADSTLTPWSGNPPVDLSNSFQITSGPNGSPCPADAAHRPFAPTMSAGTANPAAGQFSPFVLRLTRQPGEQELTRLSADLPPGILGKLAGVSQCSDAALASIPTGLGTGAAEAANPSCPANSQVGYARVGAGSGAPFYIPGRVYLAGPYRGAPLSVAIVTPALAGPFDLGNVVVRSALNIDHSTAQIHVTSDPIPTILQGIPLDIRDVRVVLDRSNFTLNPTNCSVMSTTGSVGGAGGDLTSPADDTTAPVSDRFQVGGCAGLGFNPHLSTTLNGTRADTHRSSHPNLIFGLHANPGDANLASVAVTLPQAFQIDQANLGNICSETQLVQNECAGRNTIGTASATTPLLDTPLSGPVYAVSGSGGLPKLAVILHGPPSMPIELVVRGITDTVGARIRNTFPLVPDAPITDFTLSINGGPGGYLVNNTELCPSTKASKKKKRKISTGQRSDVVFTGQNGDTLTTSVPLTAPCGKARHKHRKHKRARHRR